jgi:hypothetical protein
MVLFTYRWYWAKRKVKTDVTTGEVRCSDSMNRMRGRSGGIEVVRGKRDSKGSKEWREGILYPLSD